MQHFDQAKIGKVAIQPGGGTLARFLNGVDRKFDADAASFTDAFAHAFGQNQMVAVAWRQVAAGLGNADNRAARAQFFKAEAEVEITL